MMTRQGFIGSIVALFIGSKAKPKTIVSPYILPGPLTTIDEAREIGYPTHPSGFKDNNLTIDMSIFRPDYNKPGNYLNITVIYEHDKKKFIGRIIICSDGIPLKAKAN